MGNHTDDLPNYTNPPVVEVAASIQFAPLKGFAAAHVGGYWDTIRNAFDRVEEQPQLPHMTEREDLTPGPNLTVQLSQEPQLPRTWFISRDDSELIQLQRDRFGYNWRKREDAQEYPRYETVRKNFWKHWKDFKGFLRTSGLEAPSIDQCELTYVNRIPKGACWADMGDLETLFRNLSWAPREGFLPHPEIWAWRMSFKLSEGSGRLHVNASPVFVPPENELQMRLTLTVRGRPKEETLNDENILDWFDTARRWIVRGFVDLVTDKTDGIWGRGL